MCVDRPIKQTKISVTLEEFLYCERGLHKGDCDGRRGRGRPGRGWYDKVRECVWKRDLGMNEATQDWKRLARQNVC